MSRWRAVHATSGSRNALATKKPTATAPKAIAAFAPAPVISGGNGSKATSTPRKTSRTSTSSTFSMKIVPIARAVVTPSI